MCQPINGRIPKYKFKRQENQIRKCHFVMWWWKLTSVRNSMGSNLEPADFICFMVVFWWSPMFPYSFDRIDRAGRYVSVRLKPISVIHSQFNLCDRFEAIQQQIGIHGIRRPPTDTSVSVAIAERRHINSIYESWHLENHKIYHRHWCAPYTPSVYSPPPPHRMSTTMRGDLFWWALSNRKQIQIHVSSLFNQKPINLHAKIYYKPKISQIMFILAT